MRLLRSALVEIRRRFICPGHRGGRRATLRASKGGSRGSPRSRLWPRSDRRSCSHRWAKALGATVIGSTSSDAKAEQARRVGCDHIVISSRESIPEAVRRFTEGRGVQVLYDAVGKDIFEELNQFACAARSPRQLRAGVRRRRRVFHRQIRQPFGHAVPAQLRALHGHAGEAEVPERKAIRRATVRHSGSGTSQALRFDGCRRRARESGRQEKDRGVGSHPVAWIVGGIGQFPRNREPIFRSCLSRMADRSMAAFGKPRVPRIDRSGAGRTGRSWRNRRRRAHESAEYYSTPCARSIRRDVR